MELPGRNSPGRWNMSYSRLKERKKFPKISTTDRQTDRFGTIPIISFVTGLEGIRSTSSCLYQRQAKKLKDENKRTGGATCKPFRHLRYGWRTSLRAHLVQNSSDDVINIVRKRLHDVGHAVVPAHKLHHLRLDAAKGKNAEIRTN
jgi:hypothetical protein